MQGCCYGTSLGKKRCLLCPCPHSLFAQLSNGDVFMFWKDSVSSCGPAFFSLSPLFSCYALTTSRLSVSAPLLLGSVTVLPGGIVLPLLASAAPADNLDKHTDINATADQKFGFPDVCSKLHEKLPNHCLKLFCDFSLPLFLGVFFSNFF